MKSNGLDIPRDYIASGNFTYKSGVHAGRALLGIQNPPSAVFASNDDMAAGVVSAAHMMGFKIPDDLSVIGFDNTEMAINIWPELTTVKQPIMEMAFSSIALLNAYIRGNKEELDRIGGLLDYELIHRESVAAPKIH